MSSQPDYENITAAQKKAVRQWMALYATEYDNATLAAEACGDDLDLHGPPPHFVIPEDVYDIALDYFEEK